MLVAHNENKQLFVLHRQFSRDELQLLKKQQQFFCPQCNEPLQLKIGQIRIPHFAHFHNSECDNLFSERESEAHLLGKQHLYELFEKLQLSPILEPFLPQIQQRPDILIEHHNRLFAIEFQCSQLALGLFTSRTKGYLEVNVTPIWIVHTPFEKLKGLGIQKIKINQTMSQYLLQNNGQRYLMTYDVKQELFYYISNITHLKKTQYIGQVHRIPLKQQQFPFLIPSKISLEKFDQLFSLILNFRDDYMLSRLLLSKRGVNDQFLRAIYELRLTGNRLPIFIGIPVRNTNAFEEFYVEWQVQLFYFLKCHELTPQTMNANAVPYFFEWASFAMTIERKIEVTYYLSLLKRLNVQSADDHLEKRNLIEVLYDELVAIG
ncbi:competence protein CoiA [Solibacillus daqui]|uniref:competence protein CoiA n=1 Tax=Solibacillus daqui TaxID=2912187 RepID=UPI0023653C2D|nr:competence protein CoiA family protein [Solibacillus daqui]